MVDRALPDGVVSKLIGSQALPKFYKIKQIFNGVVLDLTEQSHGNGLGLGLADYTVTRAFEKFSFETTYPNVMTNTATSTGKLPVILANDLLAIRAAVKTCSDYISYPYRLFYIHRR